MNTCYRIKKNHGNELPSNIVFLDVQTSQEKDGQGKPILSSAHIFQMAHTLAYRRRGDEWYARTCKKFVQQRDLWSWLRLRCRRKEPSTVFAFNWHFVGQASHLWQELDCKNFTIGLPERTVTDDTGGERKIREWKGFCAIEDKPFVLYLVCRSGTIRCVDVTNYYDMSIADISKSFGRTANTDYAKCQNEVELADCAETRLVAISECMLKTLNNWRSSDRGNWQPTAARLAWSNWRHSHMNLCQVTIDNSKIDRTFERQGYFGGEVNHWYRGQYDGPVYKVDCVGLYASQMLSGLYPTSIRTSGQFGPSVSPPESDKVSSCMAEVTVRGERDLPMRKMDGGVDYPSGMFHTVLCGSELQSAYDAGRIQLWHRVLEYNVGPAFLEYVTYWWTLRKQAKEIGDTATYALAKLMMNSLYGRFAQKSPTWDIMTDMVPPIQWGNFVACCKKTGKFEKLRSIAGVVQRKKGFEEKKDTWPAISAIVTSNGREYIRRIRRSLGSRAVLAQSTDSFLLTEKGYAKIGLEGWIDSTRIGYFRTECDYQGINIVTANRYTSGTTEVISGACDSREKMANGQWKTYRTRKSGEVISLGLSEHVPVVNGTFVLTPGRDLRTWNSEGWTDDGNVTN